MDACGLCGGELDDHGVRVTITFAAGLSNNRETTVVPYRMNDWPICWKCFRDPKSEVLRLALADEYIEPVTGRETENCMATCRGGRIMARRSILARILSARQGSRGLPESWARCPVCLGPCEVERAA
jgi:hypothetical protein